MMLRLLSPQIPYERPAAIYPSPIQGPLPPLLLSYLFCVRVSRVSYNWGRLRFPFRSPSSSLHDCRSAYLFLYILYTCLTAPALVPFTPALAWPNTFVQLSPTTSVSTTTMHLNTGTFITVLLAAAAQDVAAAPQNPNQVADNGSVRVQTVPNTAPTPIPPEVLAAQQASASAAAAAAAAANSAAVAESGLRQPPGLQTGAAPVSLRPLPGLGTGVAAVPPLVSVDSSAVAPPATTAIVETQPALVATGVQSAPATLRRPPGLNTEAPASLIVPPGLVSSVCPVHPIQPSSSSIDLSRRP